MFDLGEFDQKGTKATKYGDKEGLLNAIHHLKERDIKVLFDVVFNHKMGADEKEQVSVRKVNPENRNEIDDEVIEALGYTRFTFPGRKGHIHLLFGIINVLPVLIVLKHHQMKGFLRF